MDETVNTRTTADGSEAKADVAVTMEGGEPTPEEDNANKDELEIFESTPNINDNDQHSTEKSSGCSKCLKWWSHFIENQKVPLLRILKRVALFSATRPIQVITCVSLISLILLGVGFMTNFRIESDGDYLWSPIGSRSVAHRDWIWDESGFGASDRVIEVQINRGGEEVLGLDGVRRVFGVLDLIKSQPEHISVCALTEEEMKDDPNFEPCPTIAVTGFWDHDSSAFETFAANATDDDVIEAMSGLSFTNGVLVNRVKILGAVQPPVHDNAYGKVFDPDEVRLQSAKAYHINTNIRTDIDEETTLKFEKGVIDDLLNLRKEWKQDPSSDWELEFITIRSFDDELERAIVSDIPLMVGTFVIMGSFCGFYFAKRDRVLSRGAMGTGAVVSVLLSLMTGYGLLFCIGIPFTSLTQIFPFILIGIGLDDGFIIIGAFDRTDTKAKLEERIEQTMDEIGVSIFVSTLTTFMAFMLGSVTQIPAIRWFCFYAGPCVFIDFIYQITFFIAVLELDQIRIRSNRYDITCCWKRPHTNADEITDGNPNEEINGSVSGEERENEDTEVAQDDGRESMDAMENEVDVNDDVPQVDQNKNLDFTSRLMVKYVSFILRPTTKVCVLIFFTILLVLGAISTSKMEEAFDFRIMTPSDSYLDAYLDATEIYAVDDPGIFDVFAYSRGVDFTVEENRMAMDNFVNDMVGLEQITHFPTYYWHRDFKFFINQTSADIKSKSFNDQIAMFLDTEPYKTIYADHIVRDDAGNVIESRVMMSYDNVDGSDVKDQVTALLDQREAARSQPLNSGKSDWAFFSYANIYTIWEFYDVVVNELILTTALAISSVAIITLFFIPHPAGCVIVTITVSMVFVDLLGLMQVAGLDINSVTSIGLVMSIGLVVDFVMHVVHMYFEVDEDTRDKKVAQTLMTMGKSILIGGFSTFLGTLPLCLGSSEVFWTFFITFLGIVSLGVSHGIMFVPVILSLVAPVYRPGSPHVPKQRYLTSSVRSLNHEV